MNNDWNDIVEYLMNSDECKDIHKMAYLSIGWIYITEHDGTRHKITNESKAIEVRRLVWCIKNRVEYKKYGIVTSEKN